MGRTLGGSATEIVRLVLAKAWPSLTVSDTPCVPVGTFGQLAVMPPASMLPLASKSQA